ncbi:hypothetical protein [Pseudomonas sp.]|nr:hypothetical protein D5S10_28310 [Pseudomonas savastanoi]
MRGTSFQIDIPSAAGQPRVLLTVNVEFSSHCVSRGPKEGDHIDFHLAGVERMVIDHRRIKREFKEDRHALSFLPPEIVRTFKDRRCFFTGKENFLTLELGEILPGYDAHTKYEIYFNVRKDDHKNTVKLFIESVYVRDEHAENEPVNFKKEDKITAWKLFLKRARGQPVRGHKGNNLKLGKR